MPAYHMNEMDLDWAPTINLGKKSDSHIQRSQRLWKRRTEQGVKSIISQRHLIVCILNSREQQNVSRFFTSTSTRK